MSNDRLAEALRDSTFVAAMLDAICETDGTVDRMSARDAAYRVRNALQAHAAQAQPPAASVTDAMVERACKKYAFREDGAAFPDAYSDEEVLAERTLMREFLEHVLLATQECAQWLTR